MYLGTMQHIHIRVDDKLHAALRIYCFGHGRTVTEVLVSMIEKAIGGTTLLHDRLQAQVPAPTAPLSPPTQPLQAPSFDASHLSKAYQARKGRVTTRR